MRNIKLYENDFENNPSEDSNDDQELDTYDALLNLLETLKERIRQHLSSRSMELESMDCEDDETFVIEYGSKAYDGSLPNRLSYYIEDLCDILSEEMGTELTWHFGPNHRCSIVTFNLDKPLDLKYMRAKNVIKYI
jgi:hypothetical protein